MMEQMYSEDSLLQQMDKGHQFIIINENEKPVGFASYGETVSGIFKLHKIYILPSRQGKGAGRFAIEQIIADILPQGAKTLRLNVNRHNKAKNFYEKLGFEVAATEDIDIGNGFFMNDYVMEKRFNLDI
jgi:ribosomal protein S18 acetylase RimI-like enzyme